jgi:serine/threonine protein kinase
MLRDAQQPFVYLVAQLTLHAVLDFQRWMAPEVCLCLPYGLKADVYSFGLLFYQLLSLKLPFGDIKESMCGEEWYATNDTPLCAVFLARQNQGMLVPQSIGPPNGQLSLRPFPRRH